MGRGGPTLEEYYHLLAGLVFLASWIGFAIAFGPLGIFLGWMPAIPIALLSPFLLVALIYLLIIVLALALFAAIAAAFLYFTGLSKAFGF